MLRCAVMVVIVSVVAVQAEADEPTAKDFYEFADYWAGQWDVKYTVFDRQIQETLGGKMADGEMSITWSPMKRCQEVQIRVDGKLIRHAFWGFDPGTKRWRGIAFGADGSYEAAVHGPEMLNAKYGKPFKTESSGALADGSPISGEWTTTLIDENTYKVELFGIRDGKREKILTVRSTRKERG